VNNGRVDFFVALVGLHGAVAALTAALMYFRLRVKAPKGA